MRTTVRRVYRVVSIYAAAHTYKTSPRITHTHTQTHVRLSSFNHRHRVMTVRVCTLVPVAGKFAYRSRWISVTIDTDKEEEEEGKDKQSVSRGELLRSRESARRVDIARIDKSTIRSTASALTISRASSPGITLVARHPRSGSSRSNGTALLSNERSSIKRIYEAIFRLSSSWGRRFRYELVKSRFVEGGKGGGGGS